jgi:recombinational DNA repair ATPase RecF
VRIKSISLAWFRGAAEFLTLELGSKSAVIYGENGAGKSSFVDAIEYVLNDGKIGHLSHEYSGRHQEKGVINTHTPADANAVLAIALDDDSELRADIKRNGTAAVTGAASPTVQGWDYRRTVLRQDEVAAFIRSTKGGKYSEILPLLGLRPLEFAAENVRQLAKALERQGRVRESKAQLEMIKARRDAVFGGSSDPDIVKTIAGRYEKYCGQGGAIQALTQCEAVTAAIGQRMTHYSDEQRRHLILGEMAGLDLMSSINAVRSATAELANAAEPLLAEKLEVLRSTGGFIAAVQPGNEVACPACGRPVPVQEFRTHVNNEQERLKGVLKTLDERKAAIGVLCDRLNALKASVSKSEVGPWLAQKGLEDSAKKLAAFSVAQVRVNCTDDDLQQVETEFMPLVVTATGAAKDAPPEVHELAADTRLIEVAREVVASGKLAERLKYLLSLASFLESLESGVRDEIRGRSQKVIDELSADIQAMWTILHPGEEIEGVRLYMPEGSDKAIDIELKFFGVDQESPRLTLSEGYRNSLGLCLFLAMAKREAETDPPLFLDDVVVSLDRKHRGMIVELLEKEFRNRQVILLTHDRDWYAELRERLDSATWLFKALLPYDKPAVGIRWSAKTSTFGDARAFLTEAPDAAGNTARKIMDTELALRAERLKVRMPYLGGNRNDHRTGHDFLFRIIADGAVCFRRKGASGGYEAYADAITALRSTDKLLVTWGNKASHSFDVVRPEAEKLIAECEATLELFVCPNCRKAVYKLTEASAELLQCECGHLQWRYGKA